MNMDSDSANLSLEYLGSSGIVLSVEQKASLQTSLVILKREHKFHKVKFWGIIKGIQNDYFIVQGVGKHEINDRKALYSQDCLQWNLLPHVDEGLKMKSALLQGRFAGDPSYVYEHTATQRIGVGENAREQTSTIEMKEDDRLAAVVARIDEDVAIVPRGAYIRTPLGEVLLNRSFEGLGLAEAKNLQFYLHFRKPQNKTEKNIQQSLDFLDSIDKDIPKGSWTLQLQQGGASVVLRSLLWIGLVAYHVPGTPSHGYFYCGTGEKNADLTFML